MENNNYEEQSISLGEIFDIIKKYFWLLAAATILAGIAFGIYAFRVAKPVYESFGDVVVQVKLGDDDRYNPTESNRQVPTIMSLVTKSPKVSINASEKLMTEKAIDISPEAIRKGLSTSNDPNTLLIRISFQSTNKEIAPVVTEYVIDALINLAKYDISDDQDFQVNVNKIYASEEAKQIAPNKTMLVLVGAILGGTIGLIAVFVNETVSSGFKTKEELERVTKTVVLGVIPEFEVKGVEK